MALEQKRLACCAFCHGPTASSGKLFLVGAQSTCRGTGTAQSSHPLFRFDTQASAQLYQEHLAANGLPVEPFQGLAWAEKEAAWRADVWGAYQAVTEQLSVATTLPVLSHIDNMVNTKWCKITCAGNWLQRPRLARAVVLMTHSCSYCTSGVLLDCFLRSETTSIVPPAAGAFECGGAEEIGDFQRQAEAFEASRAGDAFVGVVARIIGATSSMKHGSEI